MRPGHQALTGSCTTLSVPALGRERAIKNFFFSIWVELRPFEGFCRHKPWAIPRIRRHLSTETASSPYTESLSGQTPSIRFALGPDDYVASVSAGLPVGRAKSQCFQTPDLHVCFFRYISRAACLHARDSVNYPRLNLSRTRNRRF